MSAEKNSPIPFKDVPEGSMFWHKGIAGGYAQLLKLAEHDADVQKTACNAVVVVRNPSRGYLNAGWLTTFRDETEVFLEKPEELVEMLFTDVPAGCLFRTRKEGYLLIKASEDVEAYTKLGEKLNAMLVEGQALGWFQRISSERVFVLKDTLAGKQEGEEA